MAKFFALICFAFAFISIANAADFREWSGGKLNWEDFQEKENANKISELSYQFGFRSDNYNRNDTIFYHYKAIAYMNPQDSWVDPAHKNPKTLEYNQTVFDIIEYYRRKLQYELNRSYSENLVNYNFNNFKKDMNLEIEDFKQASQNGSNYGVVQKWSEEYKEKLENTKTMDELKCKDPLYGIGVNVSLSRNTYTGSLNSKLTPGFGFLIGFDFAVKRSVLFLNFTLSSTNIDYDYSGMTNWFNNDNPLLTVIDISYGYSVINNKSLRLTPFAGLGITELSESKQESGNPFSITDYNILFGINADLKFFKFLSLKGNPLLGSKNYGEISGRIRLFGRKTYYYSDLRGYSVNLGIGVSGFTEFVKFK